jgi:hypothetical protein
MSTKIKVPEGWGVKDFSVELKPGKPEGATSWFDIQGRPVVLKQGTWSLQRQAAPSPRKLTPQEIEQKKNVDSAPKRQKAPAPRKLTPQEVEQKGSGRGAQVPQPKTDSEKTQTLTPEEQEYYNQFSSIAKEKIADGTKKSFYPDPEQAKKDEENRKRRFAPYMSLSEDQLSAISAYTSEWDLNMNSLLRGGKIELSAKQRLTPNMVKPSEAQIKKSVQDLTSALEQLPKAPQGSFSRAVSGNSDFIKQLQTLKEGDTIEDPGFSSFTSGGAPVVDRFLKGEPNSDQNVVFEVESDQMRDISPISRYENEKEHMLPPGAKFRVIGRRESSSRTAGRHTVIQLQQIA